MHIYEPLSFVHAREHMQMRINVSTRSSRKGTFMTLRYGSSRMHRTLELRVHVCVCFCWCPLIFPYLVSHRGNLAATEQCGCRSHWRIFRLFLRRWRKIGGSVGSKKRDGALLAKADAPRQGGRSLLRQTLAAASASVFTFSPQVKGQLISTGALLNKQ